MGITTSTSIHEAKQPVCSGCGHPGSLFVVDPNGRKVHADRCPLGPPPDPEPVLIAHDPLGDEMGSDLRALKRLQQLGRGHRLTGMPDLVGVVADEVIGTRYGRVQALSIDELEARARRDAIGPAHGPTIEEKPPADAPEWAPDRVAGRPKGS